MTHRRNARPPNGFPLDAGVGAPTDRGFALS